MKKHGYWRVGELWIDWSNGNSKFVFQVVKSIDRGMSTDMVLRVLSGNWEDLFAYGIPEILVSRFENKILSVVHQKIWDDGLWKISGVLVTRKSYVSKVLSQR